jgi:hypothetical protein
MDVKRYFRGPVFWVILTILALLTLSQVVRSTGGYKKVDTAEAIDAIRQGRVESARVIDRDQRLELTLKSGVQIDGSDRVRASYVDLQQTEIIRALEENRPPKQYDVHVPRQSWFVSLLFTVIPVLLILVIFFFLINNMQGGGSRVMQFGRSKAKLVSKDTPKTTFADVAGADEAVEELHEIKEFLESPAKFQAIGAKIPKGVLLYGPPARARRCSPAPWPARRVCRSTPISGSDFVEMFVGVGASRVRDLFEQAKANAPAIVFIDEIDAVGRHRGAGSGRRPRRARADAQPAARRDGRLRRQGRRHPHRRHQPARHPRPALLRPAASTARSPSSVPTSRAGTRSCRCTRRASRSRLRSTCARSPGARPASPAPTWPTCSTRPPCSPLGWTASSSTPSRWTRRSTASSPARRSGPGS